MAANEQQAWHALSAEECLQHMASPSEGLSHDEAALRLQQ